MKKLRIISILLAMALVFTLMPAIALADESNADSDGGTSESTSDAASDSADDAGTGDASDDSASEPASEPSDDSASEPSDDSASEPASEPSDDSASEPASEPSDDSASEPASEPSDDSASEPASEAGDDSASEPASEPTDAPASEPIDAPVGEPTGEVIGEVVGEINAAQPVMAMSFMAAPAAAPVALVEPQPDKDATAEKNMDWANSLRVDFYLRLDDQQVISANGGGVVAEAGQKPGEQTSATGKNDYKTSGYTSVLATGKLGESLAYYFAGGDGFSKYQSVLASDYNGGSFKLDDFKLADDQKAKLEGLGNVEWYVAKAYNGKINVDGIIVPIKTEEKEPEEPVPGDKEPEEPTPGDREPVIIYDGGDDDGDDENDDGYYALVAIDDEGVPLSVAAVEPAATIFIMDEEVPLANLPQTGSSAAATAAAAGAAIIMLGAAMLCKKEN